MSIAMWCALAAGFVLGFFAGAYVMHTIACRGLSMITDALDRAQREGRIT